MAKEKLQIIVEAETRKAVSEMKKLIAAQKKVEKASGKSDASFKRQRISTAGLRRDLGALRNNLLLVTFAFGGIAAAANKLINSFKIQSDAEAKLAAGLRNVKSASADATEILIKQAGALQQLTRFGDEAIISAQAMLATFQLNETAILKLTPRILDLAQATGTELQAAAILVGKAFTGLPSALSRTGVIIDKVGLSIARANGPVAEFNFLIKELDKNFGGLAQALAATDLGRIEQMQNAIGDIGEQIGKELVPAKLQVTSFALAFLRLAKNLDFATPFGIQYQRELAIMAAELAGANVEMGEFNRQLRLTAQIAAKRKELISQHELNLLIQRNELLLDDGVISAQDKLTLLLVKDKQVRELANEGLITQIELEKALLEIANKRLEIEFQQGEEERRRLKERERAALEVFANVARAADTFAQADIERARNTATERKEIENKRFQDDVERIRKLEISEGKINERGLRQLEAARILHNKNLEFIDDEFRKKARKANQKVKQFLIAEAIANTAVAATKALKLGPLLGPIAAAAITAVGFAEVAKIKAQEFKHGGISTGGAALVGEAGPELVNLPAGSKVFNNTDSRRIINNQGPQTIIVQIAGHTVASVLAPDLERAAKLGQNKLVIQA